MSFKFTNLIAWKKSRELVFLVYKTTDNFPQKELFALTSQMNRAAVSILANIAEGSSRKSKKDFAHFLEISLGSAFELESLLIVALDLGYIKSDTKRLIDEKIIEVEKLINGLARSLYEK